jgi:ATP-binding cassette, subfamily G (WHITE), member 2, SNQ2
MQNNEHVSTSTQPDEEGGRSYFVFSADEFESWTPTVRSLSRSPVKEDGYASMSTQKDLANHSHSVPSTDQPEAGTATGEELSTTDPEPSSAVRGDGQTSIPTQQDSANQSHSVPSANQHAAGAAGTKLSTVDPVRSSPVHSDEKVLASTNREVAGQPSSGSSTNEVKAKTADVKSTGTLSRHNSDKTLASRAHDEASSAERNRQPVVDSPESSDSEQEQNPEQETKFEEMKSAPESRPPLAPVKGTEIKTEDDLFRVLCRRRSSTVSAAETHAEDKEIERLMSRLFGQARQEHSEEEKTRHSGVIFRDLTVKGVGLGASLQPTVGDIFSGVPRFFKILLRRGPKAATGKPSVRELISHFNGCVRPGEMLLVLGRPGAGCTTFLKAFCNQRAGFKDVLGKVTYGGTDARTMVKTYRGEIIYNPEDDLHYATLSVRRTLTFALQTRAPGKESRLEGESRDDYVKEFLRVVAKLLWIEHTMETKVGNEYVHGVSGGERKRVSIAEALITRASVQGWDNSSKGLDSSTALEYVQSLRTLTNMAHVSTAVSLYQAGESLYKLVDKVLLIDKGQCLYYGLAEDAKQYFINLGFECPERWTTADFLTSVSDPFERSIRPGWENRIPRSAEDFAAVYKKSDAYQKNIKDIQSFEAQLEEQKRVRAKHSTKSKKNYTIPFYQQVLVLTHRQLFIMLGDKASLIGKWGGIVFQGLIVGSMFYDLPDTVAGAFTRGGVLFFILLFNALLALAEQTAAFESKPIVSICVCIDMERLVWSTDNYVLQTASQAQELLLLPTFGLRTGTNPRRHSPSSYSSSSV